MGTVAQRPHRQEVRLTLNNDPSGGPADVKQRPAVAAQSVVNDNNFKNRKSTPALPVNQINKNNDDGQGGGILKYKKLTPPTPVGG